MQSAIAARRTNGYGVLTIAVLGAALVATGRPDAETLAAITAVGVPEMAVRIGVYVTPVLVMIAALLLGRALVRGRSPAVRWAAYAGFGAIAGFVLGLCLDLFAGAPDVANMLGVPLAEPSDLEFVLWTMGVLCVVLGALVSVIATFGAPAIRALQVEEADPECLDVRRGERSVFGWSALAMTTLGVACFALAVSRQAPEAARTVPVLLAVLAGCVSAWANFVLWRGFDELQRRNVVDGYAISAVAVTLGAFAWVALQALGLAPPADALGVFLALIGVQLVATSYVTSAVMGQAGMLGKSL